MRTNRKLDSRNPLQSLFFPCGFAKHLNRHFRDFVFFAGMIFPSSRITRVECIPIRNQLCSYSGSHCRIARWRCLNMSTLHQDNLTYKEWEYVKTHGPCLDKEYEALAISCSRWLGWFHECRLRYSSFCHWDLGKDLASSYHKLQLWDLWNLWDPWGFFPLLVGQGGLRESTRWWPGVSSWAGSGPRWLRFT